MKKALIILMLTMGIYSAADAQEINPYPKTINVTGSAELEIVPDEIYVQVDLREYEKKGLGKINLDKIKTEFLQIARSVGIADSNITINNYDGSEETLWIKRKKIKGELYAAISYQVKLSSSKVLDQLVEKLNDDATANFAILKTSHSKIQEYRKQLKIGAVKAAKEKANYLAEAINEHIGVAVSISEPSESYMPFVYNYANTFANTASTVGKEEETNAQDFSKIKIKYEVNVIFALR